MSLRTDRCASETLAKYEQSVAPIDVEVIARGEGAELLRESLDTDVSGVLLRKDSRTLIAVNNAHHARRQRFTIAHELGHLLLHPGRPYTVDSTIRLNWRDDLSSLASDKEEIEANAFAAALLMPRVLVRSALDDLRATRSTNESHLIETLAQRFNVSSEAMSIRLVNLGIRS